MRRLFVLTALLFGVLALVMGCSDDDEGTPTGGPTQGDTADLSFQFIDSVIGEDIFSTMAYSQDIAFSLMDSIPGASPQFSRETPFASLAINQEGDVTITDVTSFEYTESGWFVFEFEAIIVETMENDTTYVSGIDSLQLLDNGAVIDTSAVDPEIDEIKIRGHIQWSHSDDASGASHHSFDIEAQVSGLDTLVLINATAIDTLGLLWSTDSASCTLDVFNNLTATNVLIHPDVEGACPESGRLVASATVDLSCTGGGEILSINWTSTTPGTLRL